MDEIAIIGAGVSGLAAAWSLARDGHNPGIFEKSRGLSGRAASRSRGDVRFDHGANFFRLDRPLVDQVVRQCLPTEDLVEIPGDVWTFDVESKVSPGDPVQNAEPKFTYRHGISQLGKLLVENGGLEVRRQTRVGQINQQPGGWELRDAEHESLGSFEKVILTAPAPQCLDLLKASEVGSPLKEQLTQALEPSRFHRQFSFILGYDQALPRSRPFHALVSTDPASAIAWLSFEEDKLGHLPDGQGALVVQMTPAWTNERVEVEREALLESVCESAAALLGDDFRKPDWWDSQRWMMAHPAEGVDPEALQCGNAEGLFFAGDSLVGKGRVPLALESGLMAAEALQASLENAVG